MSGVSAPPPTVRQAAAQTSAPWTNTSWTRMLRVLLGQRLRRDWLQLTLWIAGTVLLAYAGWVGVSQSYGTLQDRQEILAAALANPVIFLFRGLPSGASDGAFLSFELLPWLAILATMMSSFLAVRHTRGDEEAGRAELLSATPTGRTLPTIATVVHGIAANAVLGLLTALTLVAAGLDAGGSFLVGAATAATGVAFLGIGLFAAQLMRTSRAANATTMAVLVAAFLVRGFGNAAGTPGDDLVSLQSAWLVWLSPFGWAEQTRPYDVDAVWPALLGVALGLALAAVAAVLQSVRDVSAGVFAGRPGRARALPALASPHALVWRLTRGSILGWAIGGVLTGLLATSLSGIVDQVSGQNPAVAQILESISRGGSLDEAVITVFFTMLGILAGCAAAQTVARARQEEARGTVEPVLSAPVGRVRWLADYLIVATAAVLIVIAAAVAAGAAGIAAAGSDGSLYRVVAVAGAGQAAAASVFTVVTALIFVFLPRATIPLGWTLVLVATMLGLFGPLFGLPEWSTDLSPFAAGAVVDGGELDVRGTWWLVAVVVGGAAAALAAMRRRELAGDG